MIELLGRANEADRPLLDEVEERQALVVVAFGDRHDEAEIRLDHVPFREVVALFDPLGELDFLRSRQQVDLADVSEERLETVGSRVFP